MTWQLKLIFLIYYLKKKKKRNNKNKVIRFKTPVFITKHVQQKKKTIFSGLFMLMYFDLYNICFVKIKTVFRKAIKKKKNSHKITRIILTVQ